MKNNISENDKIINFNDKMIHTLLYFSSSLKKVHSIHPFFSCNFLFIKKNLKWYSVGSLSVISLFLVTSKVVLADDSMRVLPSGAIQIGKKSKPDGDLAIAIGDSATAIAVSDVSLGVKAYSNSHNSGSATALGTGAYADSISTLAVGYNTQAMAREASAFGAEASAYGQRAVSLGAYAKVNGPDDDAVALGSYSVTRQAQGVSSITLGGVDYSFAGISPTSVVSIGTPGKERQIVNVAAGNISGTSTDAVNGSQLYATNQHLNKSFQTLNQNIDNGSIGVLQRQADTQGNFTGVSAVTEFGKTANIPGRPQKLTNVAVGILSDTSTDVVNGSQLYATNQNVENLSKNINNSPNSVVQKQIDTQGNFTGVTALVETGKTANIPGTPQKLTNVAVGSLSDISTDAVNGSQLYVTNQNVENLSKNISNSSNGAVQRQTDTKGSPTGVSVLVETGKTANAPGTPQKLTNVAVGDISATSTDAVNGSQLYTVVVGATKNAVTYDSDYHRRISLNGGDSEAPVTISNVAAAHITAESSEAVRGSQLYRNAQSVARNFGGGSKVNSDGSISAPSYVVEEKTYDNVGDALDGLKHYTDSTASQTLRSANQYTDKKFHTLYGLVNKVRTEARQAAAVGLAAASLRYDNRPGKLSIAIGSGHWLGHNAGAVGMGYTNLTQKVRANVVTTAVNSHVGVGAGVSFTFN